MRENILNINITGDAKEKLEQIHEETQDSYSRIIDNLLENSPKPIDIINNSFDNLKKQLGNDSLKHTLERIRVITIKCYKNQDKLNKIDRILEKVMKELGE